MVRKELAIPVVGCATICIFLLYFVLLDGGGGAGKTLEASDEKVRMEEAPARYSLAQMREFAFRNAMNNEFKHPMMQQSQQHIVAFNQIVENSAKNGFSIDIGHDDVLVFLHIQKTAGTSFERFLVRRLNITHPCECDLGAKKKCQCRRPNGRIWLFSRFSTGWACGLHADYTELIASGCVGNKLDTKEGKHHSRRLYLTTFLRQPVERFISEYSHVQRGSTWTRSRHICAGRPPTPDELPMCFDPDLGWDGVGLDEFLACSYNLAFNRQTRMLADLNVVHCYNTSAMAPVARDQMLLESAKRNLRQTSFFGLTERMSESQYMFERTFGLKFNGDLAEWNKSKSAHVLPSEAQLALIRRKNGLDLELYEFAKRLFERRIAKIGSQTTANDSSIGSNNSLF